MSENHQLTRLQRFRRMRAMDSAAQHFDDKLEYWLFDRWRLKANADDISTYQYTKVLGLLAVNMDEAEFSHRGPEDGLRIKRGDRNLMLALPPIPRGMRSREIFDNSLSMVAQYIVAQNLDPRYVMGITYPRMAQIAIRHFDFRLAHIRTDSLPRDVREGVLASYNSFTDAGRAQPKDKVNPILVYKDRSQFLADHLPQAQE